MRLSGQMSFCWIKNDIQICETTLPLLPSAFGFLRYQLSQVFSQISCKV